MMHIRYFRMVMVVTLYLMQFLSLQAWGREGTEGVNIFGFAESLYEEGDYYRAIGEYKRYQFLYPNSDLDETAEFRIAESYFKARRLAEAVAACDQFLIRFPRSPRYFEMLYLKGRVEKFDKKSDDALRTFDVIINAKDSTYSDKALYQKALIALERADWQGTRDFLSQFPSESPLHSSASTLLTELQNVEQLAHKSPTTAGILAALLPGAGHLYVERPRDALMAFLLNGSFIWGAVELFHHDNYVGGSILTFFELGWYSGNIYSAVSSAHKYNQQKQDDFIRNIINNYSLSFYRDSDVRTVLLTKRF